MNDTQNNQSKKPPRGPGWKSMIVIAAVVIVTLIIGVSGASKIKAGFARTLEMIGFKHDHADHAESAEGLQYYTCGMHPWVILPKPGDCPICHMKLTPLDPAKFTGEITIDPVVVQNMGVRVGTVTTGPLVRTIRTVGTVDYDETRVRDVNTKIGGWIEKLNVDFVGADVTQGDPLFDLYSPELYAAQEEYLLAWRNKDKIGASFVPEAAQGAKDLLESARTRLEYYDITDTQIAALQKANQPAKTMTIESPYTGIVIEKHANEGMKVDPGMRVFRIADLSKVWVMVTMYEYQIPYVSLGQRATMTLPYIPGVVFEGKVIYIYPYLDKKTRQINIRLEFDNPGGLLKPGMYAGVQLKSLLAGERTLTPRSAVIDTGERQVAFVSLGEGKFEPREVKMGIATEAGLVEIREGLKPGELVVVSGQFLIDSEAKMREALAKMIRGDLASDQQAVAASAGASELAALPDAAADALSSLLQSYFAIGDQLAGDSIKAIAAPAGEVAKHMETLLGVALPDNPHFWHQHEEAATVRGKALELVTSDNLEDARLKFADLSVALNKLVKATGVPMTFGQEVQQLHCPMYRDGQGGSVWLQPTGAVHNPFYGSMMLECFDERKTMPVTGGKTDKVMEVAPSAPMTKPQTQPAASLAVPAETQSRIDTLYQAYLELQQQLVRDEFKADDNPVSQVHAAAMKLSAANVAPLAALAAQVASASSESADGMTDARVVMKGLSDAMVQLAEQFPPSRKVAPVIYHAYCPMSKGNWLQTGQTVANPYYGASMLTCGSIKHEFAARAAEEK